jgi:hypothetical protein
MLTASQAAGMDPILTRRIKYAEIKRSDCALSHGSEKELWSALGAGLRESYHSSSPLEIHTDDVIGAIAVALVLTSGWPLVSCWYVLRCII